MSDNIDFREYTKFFEENQNLELNALISKTREQFDDYRNVVINIALIGMSGVGKSTLINSLRGLEYTVATKDNPSIARVGYGAQCTTFQTRYSYPNHPNIFLWDLPGFGTKDFPFEEYKTKINFEDYDAFILCSASVFNQWSIALANEIDACGKRCFLVRTKFDQDYLSKAKFFRSRALTDEQEEALKEEIRHDISTSMEQSANNNRRVYLLSTETAYQDKWDFDNLINDLIATLKIEQQNAMIRSLSPMSKSIIQRKCDYLRARATNIAKISGLCGTLPVPGVSFLIDGALIIKEINSYTDQFGLNQENLDYLASTYSINDQIKNIIGNSKTLTAILSRLGIGAIFELFPVAVAANTVEELVKYVPILGSVVGGATSFLTTRYVLNRVIDDLEATAKQILEIVLEKSRQNSEEY